MAVLRINLDWGSPWNPMVVAPWVAASRKVKMDLTPSLKHEYPVGTFKRLLYLFTERVSLCFDHRQAVHLESYTFSFALN